MGCWYTKHDINDRHPNVFKVMNVDEQGQLVSPGQLELTETEMVLYQKGKTSTKWPLAYIRRYGFESELFSFECGRRCPTGPGIYAFRCRRAELLFNLLQERIAFQRTTQEDTSVNHTPNDYPIPLVTSGPAVPVRPALPPVTTGQDTGYLEPLSRPVITRSQSAGFPRLNSVLSNNGPVTPPMITSPDQAPEHNNNKRASLTLEHSYSNTILPPAVGIPNVLVDVNTHMNMELRNSEYMNVDQPVPISPSPSVISETSQQVSESFMNNSHLYMNVTPGTQPDSPVTKSEPSELLSLVILPLLEEEEKDQNQMHTHCYANLETEEIESLRARLKPSETHSNLVSPPAIANVSTREVVYAILDLEKTKDDNANQSVNCLPTLAVPDNSNSLIPPLSTSTDTPKKLAKGYTVIDFNKTEAVSQIAKPKQDCEGSRKTRHNSTISELGQSSSQARHSSSLSD